MKIKKIIGIVTMAVMLLVSVVFVQDAYARGSRGGSRSGGSRSYSRPSSNKSKPSYKTPAKKAPKATKKASKPKKAIKKASKKASKKKSLQNKSSKKLSKAQQKKQSAAFNNRKNAEKAKYTKKDTSRKVTSDTYRSNSVHQRARQYDRNTYYSRRDSYYGGIGYSQPGYFHSSYYPSYGMYNSSFLMMMLMTGNHSYYYHHRTDPGIQSFMLQSKQLENAELRLKIQQMEAQAAGMNGTAVNPDYVPDGMDADLMMAEDTLAEPETKSGPNAAQIIIAILGIACIVGLVVFLTRS